MLSTAPARPLHAARLRHAGLRVTQPRLLVLRALDALPADDAMRGQQAVYRLLERQGRGLPHSTLYRVLRDLAAAGLLPAGRPATVRAAKPPEQGADRSFPHDSPATDDGR